MGDFTFIGHKIILTLESVAVVEVLAGENGYPFRRIIEEYDSTNGKYDEAMRQARGKLRNLRH